MTLAITREGGPAPVFSAPMTFGAGGLDAVAQVPALDAGSYVATFTLERADGSTATTVSGFRVVGAKRIRDHDEVNCRRLSEGRHACTLGLIRASTGTGAFRIRRHRKFVVEGKMRVHNGFGHIPGVSRLPAGTYVLDLLTPGRTKHVFASIRFELR